MVSLADGSPEASTVLPLARRILETDSHRVVDDAALLAAIREHAYLEGDFVLRSGKRSTYYLDKYRFETVPELLEAIGARLAARIAEVEPDAQRLAGPELGAVALAAAASLASRLPFLIVRGEAKGYGTGNRLEGAFEPGERVVLSRMWSHRAERPPMPSERYGKLHSNAGRLSASSTGRRAVWTPSRASECACIPCFVRRDVAPPRSAAEKPHG